jgi:hypothetical protein
MRLGLDSAAVLAVLIGRHQLANLMEHLRRRGDGGTVVEQSAGNGIPPSQKCQCLFKERVRTIETAVAYV